MYSLQVEKLVKDKVKKSSRGGASDVLESILRTLAFTSSGMRNHWGVLNTRVIVSYSL